MKTYLAKRGEFVRKHVVFDAANVPLGRLAVKIANALRGKDRAPTYSLRQNSTQIQKIKRKYYITFIFLAQGYFYV